MTDIQLSLDYTLSPGWLLPWVEGLREGRAVARTCESCNRVSFVPLRVCACGGVAGTWVDLSGLATVLTRTAGSDGSFALARFDGADTQTVVALSNFPEGHLTGRLRASEAERPAIILQPVSAEQST